MGLFSKRRRTKGFDADLWSDAADRGNDDTPWFADLDATEDDAALDELATNAGARFAPEDEEWLRDDPGSEIRARKR